MTKARKITRARLVVGAGFVELLVWRAPEPIPGSAHNYKYRLAYVVSGICRVRYDNEHDKRDHRHLDGVESLHVFQSLERLVSDFWRDVNERR